MKLTTEERVKAADVCRAAGLITIADKLTPCKRGRPFAERDADGLTEHQQRMRELRAEILARINDGEDEGDVIAEFERDPRVRYIPRNNRESFLWNLISKRSDLPGT